MKPSRPGLVLALVLILPGIAGGQEPERTYPQPGTFEIDWQRQVVVTNSLGAPNTELPRPAWRASALRAARQAAYRDLLEALKGVTVNASTTVRNMMVSSDVIRSKVEGIVRDFVVLDTKYYESMDVGVIVEMPLTGALTETVLLEPGHIASHPGQGSSVPAAGSRVITGVVVDARGLDAVPAMAPKILDEAGGEVYGTSEVSREYAIQWGVAGYHNDVGEASRDERVAGNPLVVRATRSTGPNGCDLVISEQDAGRIRQAAEQQGFLDECRVMIVLGSL